MSGSLAQYTQVSFCCEYLPVWFFVLRQTTWASKCKEETAVCVIIKVSSPLCCSPVTIYTFIDFSVITHLKYLFLLDGTGQGSCFSLTFVQRCSEWVWDFPPFHHSPRYLCGFTSGIALFLINTNLFTSSLGTFLCYRLVCVSVGVRSLYVLSFAQVIVSLSKSVAFPAGKATLSACIRPGICILSAFRDSCSINRSQLCSCRFLCLNGIPFVPGRDAIM